MSESIKPASECAAYKRVMLKLSGEALAAGSGDLYNREFLLRLADSIKKCRGAGVQIAIIVGAGNIWRGRQGAEMDRARADYMGMIATSINAIALQDIFIGAGLDARVLTAARMPDFAEDYTRDLAVEHLLAGRIVILGCGLGMPYISTDTAAAQRALELEADILLMAKNIDGVYTADPRTDSSAKKLDEITYGQIIAQNLGATDLTAAAFCLENNLPMLLFGLNDPENIYRAVMGEEIGTIAHV